MSTHVSLDAQLAALRFAHRRAVQDWPLHVRAGHFSNEWMAEKLDGLTAAIATLERLVALETVPQAVLCPRGLNQVVCALEDCTEVCDTFLAAQAPTPAPEVP